MACIVDLDALSATDLFEIACARRAAAYAAELDGPEPEWPELAGLNRPGMQLAMRTYVDANTPGRPPGPVDLDELRRVGQFLGKIVAQGLSIEAPLTGLLALAEAAGLDPGQGEQALAVGLATGRKGAT